MKKCSCCNIFKKIDEFHKAKANKDGHNYYCKSCMSKYSKEWRKRIIFKINRCRCGNSKSMSQSSCKLCASKYTKKWSKSEKGKDARKKHEKTKKGKLTRLKYNRSLKGKLLFSKAKSIRKRNLGFELLFDKPKEWLCDCDYHHISDGFVVAIPSFIHKQYGGKLHRKKLKHIVEIMYNISYTIEDYL